MGKKKEQWIKQLVPFDQKERPRKGSKQVVLSARTDQETGVEYFGLYIRDFDTNSIKWLWKTTMEKGSTVRELPFTAAKPKTPPRPIRFPPRKTPRITPKRPKLRR